jgi:trk system potassium uptake protein TrkA
MILGGSRTATYLASLIINGGNTVRIVERNRQVCESLCEKLPKAIIINADGTDHDVLIEEGLGSVDAFVSLTGLDEQNILSAVHASSVSGAKSVAKVNSESLARMADQIGLDTAVSPKNAVSDVVIRYVRALNESVGSDFETLYRIFDGKVEAIEFRAKSDCKILKTPLKSLNTKNNALIAGIIHDGKVIIPGGSDSVSAGDRVIIIAAGQRIDTLDDIIG